MTTCLSNVSQLTVGYQSYLQVNEGRGFWYSQGDVLWLRYMRTALSNINQVQFCPEAMNPPVGMAVDGEGYGTANEYWQPLWIGPYTGSYAINGWLYTITRQNAWMLSFYSTYPNSPVSARNSKVDPTLTPVFSDACWIDGWPMPGDAPPPTMTGMNDPLHNSWAGRGSMSIYCLSRHGNRSCIGFLDGSARAVPAAELWQLHWTADWQPRTVVIPH